MTNFTNALINETSPYLLQHAHNPVQWYPWGDKALNLAKQQQKPILLSIGYSACHWCHVMAHESFENPKTAALMNELFINIKVDREERPDLDKIYQTAHQLITQRHGGLKMAMFSLKKMALGGIYDQIGGGFCRYSVDELWMIPHFEKMLYDNGAFLSVYSQAWKLTDNQAYKNLFQRTAIKLSLKIRPPRQTIPRR